MQQNIWFDRCVEISVETRSQNFTAIHRSSRKLRQLAVEFVVIKLFGRESLHVEPS